MNQGHTWRERVPPASAGERLLDHLAGRWRHGSFDQWRERLERGELLLDGASARGDERLAAGQELQWRRPPWEEPQVPQSFALLHRDDHLLAVAKPAGLPTMPSGGRFLDHTLLHRVRARWPEATLLHRLDRGTSGVVLLARSDLARREVAHSWRRGAVRRLYRGLVEGAPREDSFEITAPIGELPHATLGRVFAVAQRGRASVTRVRVVERRATTTLVEIEIGSGRPHQIRIHLAWCGHPLVGERFYGTGGGPRAGSAAMPGDIGYRLHAERLIVPHPSHLAPLTIWCSPPSDLRATGVNV